MSLLVFEVAELFAGEKVLIITIFLAIVNTVSMMLKKASENMEQLSWLNQRSNKKSPKTAPTGFTVNLFIFVNLQDAGIYW